MSYPWYHGELGREPAEALLADAAGRFHKGEIIFLVRKSGSSPKDFVITWMKVGESVGNYMVKVMGAGANCTYVLDATCPGKKTRYFSSLPALLEHFQERDCGLPNGPLDHHVAAARMLDLPIPEELPLPPPEQGEGPELGPIPQEMRVPRNMKAQESLDDEHDGGGADIPKPPPPRKQTNTALAPSHSSSSSAPPPLPPSHPSSQSVPEGGEGGERKKSKEKKKGGCVVS